MVTFVPSLASDMDQGEDNWQQLPVRGSDCHPAPCSREQSSPTQLWPPPLPSSSTHLGRLISDRGSDLNLYADIVPGPYF